MDDNEHAKQLQQKIEYWQTEAERLRGELIRSEGEVETFKWIVKQMLEAWIHRG